MRRRNVFFAVAVVAFFLVAFIPMQRCITARATAKHQELQKTEFGGDFAYKINQPSNTFKLESDLTEISGLTMAPEKDHLLAVQDEKGKAFLIDFTDGSVKKEMKFGGSDDYEGIEYVGDEVFVVNSKGNVDAWKYKGGDKDNKRTSNTILNSDYDVEGLGALASGHLLVACKSAKSKKDRNRKVFVLDPISLEIDSMPFLSLDHVAIAAKLGRPKESPIFSPSGITVHPLTNEIYIISSPAKALVRYNSDGVLLDAVELSSKVHEQPEGITIDRDGTLFISNEGQGGSAKLHIFQPF